MISDTSDVKSFYCRFRLFQTWHQISIKVFPQQSSKGEDHECKNRKDHYFKHLSELTSKIVKCNAYFTPRSNQGLPIHYDLHDVYVVQIEGSKHWKVWKPFRKSVNMETLSFDREQNLSVWCNSQAAQEFILGESQSFYLEMGQPHLALATELDSLHLSFGIHNE